MAKQKARNERELTSQYFRSVSRKESRCEPLRRLLDLRREISRHDWTRRRRRVCRWMPCFAWLHLAGENSWRSNGEHSRRYSGLSWKSEKAWWADSGTDHGSGRRSLRVSRLPVCSGADAAKAFGKIGYAFDHQTGSHIILRHSSGRRSQFQIIASWRKERCVR